MRTPKKSRSIDEALKGTTANSICTIECQDFQSFIAKASLLNDEWVFRGQMSETWKLNSSLDRLISHPSSPNENEQAKFAQTLREQLTRFKKYGTGRLDFDPAGIDDNKLITIAQHYGLKTHLLDWTESPFVALFFAFEQANNDRESSHRIVWAAHASALEKAFGENQKGIKKLAFITSPNHLNSRLIAQKGVFCRIMGGGAIDELIKNMPNNDKLLLYKFRLRHEQRRKILRTLDQMCINAHTLYPDIFGVARYCNDFLVRG
jgi:hypothetical protein